MENWFGLSDLIEKVQELFEISLYDEGLSLLDQYKDIYSNEWEIHFLYSRAYSEQNKPVQAIPHLKLALRFNKDNPDCLLGLFYAYTQMRQIQKGARYLLKAKRMYPDNELILNALIWYYSEANDFSKAVACYEDAESLLNYNPEALRNAGIAYERLGNFNKALICFKTSLELDPDVDETRDLLADHYILRGETSKSIALYKDYLQRSPNNIRAMSRLVFCLSQNKQMQEAEKAANEIIRIYPNSPVGYVDLSYVYLNTNNIEKAIITASKALDVSPIDAEALRVKGIAYSEQKSYLLAEQSFKEALSLAPDNPEIMRDYYHCEMPESIKRWKGWCSRLSSRNTHTAWKITGSSLIITGKRSKSLKRFTILTRHTDACLVKKILFHLWQKYLWIWGTHPLRYQYLSDI